MSSLKFTAALLYISPNQSEIAGNGSKFLYLTCPDKLTRNLLQLDYLTDTMQCF